MRSIISHIVIIFTLIIGIHFEIFGQPTDKKIQFILFNDDERFEGFNDICEIVESNIKTTCEIEEDFITPYHDWDREEKEDKLEFLSEEGITHLIEGKLIPSINDEEIGMEITIKDIPLQKLHKFGIKKFSSDDIVKVSDWSEKLADNINNFINGRKIKEEILIQEGLTGEAVMQFNHVIAIDLRKKMEKDTTINNKYRFIIDKREIPGINNIILVRLSPSDAGPLFDIIILTTLEDMLLPEPLDERNLEFANILQEVKKYAQKLINQLKGE